MTKRRKKQYYYVMERLPDEPFSGGRWIRHFRDKTLSTAKKHLKEMKSWRGRRRFAIVKTNNIVRARILCRMGTLRYPKTETKMFGKVVRMVRKNR